MPLRQTFTYRLPEGLRENYQNRLASARSVRQEAFDGLRRRAAYETRPELEIEEDALKEAIELLDEEPLLTEEILKLTQWTADYYASSWGEVLKASLPAGINASVEQIVSITAEGRDELIKISSAQTVKRTNSAIFGGIGRNSAREFEKISARRIKTSRPRFDQKRLGKLFQRTLTMQVKPKRRKAVRLLPPESHETSQKPLTDAQQKLSKRFWKTTAK